jgi:hypothetical protein
MKDVLIENSNMDSDQIDDLAGINSHTWIKNSLISMKRVSDVSEFKRLYRRLKELRKTADYKDALILKVDSDQANRLTNLLTKLIIKG